MNFRAHGPFGIRRRLRNTFDNVLGGTDFVGKLSDFEPAFRVRNDTNAGITRPNLPDVLWQKALMHRTVTIPKNDAAVFQNFYSITPQLFVWIPDGHDIQPQPQTVAGISSQMLIRQKQDLIAPFQGPTHYRRSVRRSANRPVMLAAECLDRRRGVHVRAWNDESRCYTFDIIPAGFYLVNRCHVGH